MIDVVGLDTNPPRNAIVLCFDGKSQIHALDRTQPSLPMKQGRPGTVTHGYERYLSGLRETTAVANHPSWARQEFPNNDLDQLHTLDGTRPRWWCA